MWKGSRITAVQAAGGVQSLAIKFSVDLLWIRKRKN